MTTDEKDIDFAALKRRRSEAQKRLIEAVLEDFAKRHDINPSKVTVHISSHGSSAAAKEEAAIARRMVSRSSEP